MVRDTEEDALLLDSCMKWKDKHALVWSQRRGKYLAHM